MNANLKGTVDKIKVIQPFPKILVRFTLVSGGQSYNCFVGKQSLANQVLLLEEKKSILAIFGHYNDKKQIVIDKLSSC